MSVSNPNTVMLHHPTKPSACGSSDWSFSSVTVRVDDDGVAGMVLTHWECPKCGELLVVGMPRQREKGSS